MRSTNSRFQTVSGTKTETETETETSLGVEGSRQLRPSQPATDQPTYQFLLGKRPVRGQIDSIEKSL